MSAKTNTRWIFALVATLFVLSFTLLSMPHQASAAQSTQATSNSCLTCHEDLYYLHDTGCWYCITAHKDRCAGCHEGNPAAPKEEGAHFGMILHPQESNGEKCLDCHTADEAQMRMIEFETTAGFDTVIRPEEYTPLESTVLGFPEVSKPSPFENWPWLAGGVVLFGFWLALVYLSPQKP
jgi:hypothetical protein